MSDERVTLFLFFSLTDSQGGLPRQGYNGIVNFRYPLTNKLVRAFLLPAPLDDWQRCRELRSDHVIIDLKPAFHFIDLFQELLDNPFVPYRQGSMLDGFLEDYHRNKKN